LVIEKKGFDCTKGKTRGLQWKKTGDIRGRVKKWFTENT